MRRHLLTVGALATLSMAATCACGTSSAVGVPGPSMVTDAPSQPSDVSLSPADATAATDSLQSRMATCVLLLPAEIQNYTGVVDPPTQYKEGCKWGPVGIRHTMPGKKKLRMM